MEKLQGTQQKNYLVKGKAHLIKINNDNKKLSPGSD